MSLDIDAEITARVRSRRVQVPPYPAAAMKLTALLSRPDYGQQQLLDIIKMDQVLAGVLLRLANSAAYQRGDPVTDLGTAVSRVGNRELQAVAMAAGLQSKSATIGPLASLRRRAWIEALTSARVAELLATLEGASPGESFVAGLLHDIGKSLVIACLEDILRTTPGLASRTEAEWWEICERFHLELGLVLATSWGLTGELRDVVVEHHKDGSASPLIGRVALSDELVAILMAKPGMEPMELRQLLGISVPAADALAAGICALPEFIRAFEAEATSLHATESPQAIRPEPAPKAGTSESCGKPVSITGGSPQPAQGTLWSATEADVSVLTQTQLRTNCLVKVGFPGQTSDTFFAKVKSCVEKDGGFIATMSAFSLSGLQLQQWKKLVLPQA